MLCQLDSFLTSVMKSPVRCERPNGRPRVSDVSTLPEQDGIQHLDQPMPLFLLFFGGKSAIGGIVAPTRSRHFCGIIVAAVQQCLNWSNA
jgi:hypothetical protein